MNHSPRNTEKVIKTYSKNPISVLPEDVTRNIYKQFPRKVEDLYNVPTKLLSKDSELKADHPGFNDPIYCARRQQIADLAKEYKQYVGCRLMANSQYLVTCCQNFQWRRDSASELHQ